MPLPGFILQSPAYPGKRVAGGIGAGAEMKNDAWCHAVIFVYQLDGLSYCNFVPSARYIWWEMDYYRAWGWTAVAYNPDGSIWGIVGTNPIPPEILSEFYRTFA